MFKFTLNKNISEKDIALYQDRVTKINESINNKTGAGKEFLGWVDWPDVYDKNELNRIIKDAMFVRENYDVLVVCGIGGSYLGARASIEAIKGLKNNDTIKIMFLGQTLSPNYVAQILEYLKFRKFAINVISKSGTTFETSVSFRLLKNLLESQVGKDAARKAIYVTTDKSNGALRSIAEKEGYTTYVMPNDIGGRYSVFTPVGTFPLAVAGLDVKSFIKGASNARKDFDNDDLTKNDCYRYAVSRHFLYTKFRYTVEMFVTYEPQMKSVTGWLKQLYGESEGKEGKGLFPGDAAFSTDLHSFGQFIQDGSPILYETIIYIAKPQQDVAIPKFEDDTDGLNYLEGKTLSYLNRKVFEGALIAHEENHVPCNSIVIDELTEETLGYMFYFFMRACAMSAYLSGINPFDQPGVDVYKKNMFHLLGKKGY